LIFEIHLNLFNNPLFYKINYFKNPKVAKHIMYSFMRSVMTRERTKQRPLILHSQALAIDLIKYEWIKDSYKGTVVAHDGSMAIIFSSEKFIKIIQETQEIFVDGTFSVSYFDRYNFLSNIFFYHKYLINL